MMNADKISEVETAELVKAYRQAAKEHSEATEKGEHVHANEAAELIALIYSEVRRRGVQSKLLPLLFDASLGVQLWSASHALEFSSNDGEAVLRRLSAAGGLVGLDAEMTLKEWRANRLRFP
jgi:hypothetical protein